MRVVLDTNVVVSAFLSPRGNPAKVVEQWRLQAFELAVSEPILQEYQRALRYAHVAARHGLSPEDVAWVIEGFREFALVVDPGEEAAIITDDPDDDKFLSCARSAGAAYIVSGDAHLVQLAVYQGIPILTPAAFLHVLEEEKAE